MPTVSPQQTVDLDFTVRGDNAAADSVRFVIRLASDQSPSGGWQTFPVNVHFTEAKPVLWFSPDHVETGMSPGTTTETITLENSGYADMQEISLNLVNENGTAAPDWIYISSASSKDSLSPGDTLPVDITLAPGAAVPEGNHAFRLRVESANHPTRDINIYAAVTASGNGGVLFKVSDIYTGTLDDDGEVIQGLENAKIRLQNETVLTEEYGFRTDALGEALVENIPAGRYKYRVRANNHQRKTGRLWVKPGITVAKEVFLDYNLVTVDWEVNETTIEDEYEIVLNATYETDVPAPVVVEPASIPLPDMAAGDVFTGELTVANYGLVRADDVAFHLPSDDGNYTYELLGTMPETLDAYQRVVLPYRITCVSPPGSGGDDTGGGCGSYIKCGYVHVGFICANGELTEYTTSYCVTRSYGSCGGGGEGGYYSYGGDSWVGSHSGGGIGSSSGGMSGSSESISGPECMPCPDCGGGGDGDDEKETNGDKSFDVGCSVNLFTRQFTDEAYDLTVNVPGGAAAAHRIFNGESWGSQNRNRRIELDTDKDRVYFAVPMMALPPG